ncbi:MAG: hypothetical protein HGN29_05945 [Asgard group archaeon]|nr:hypothetical protein [Asgard group archaeon]
MFKSEIEARMVINIPNYILRVNVNERGINSLLIFDNLLNLETKTNRRRILIKAIISAIAPIEIPK